MDSPNKALNGFECGRPEKDLKTIHGPCNLQQKQKN